MEALTKNSIKLLFQNNYDYLVKGSPILQVNNIIFQLCGLKNIPNPPNWMIDIVLLIFDNLFSMKLLSLLVVRFLKMTQEDLKFVMALIF